jgi:tetratricopeptide (TPR) repeat protein
MKLHPFLIRAVCGLALALLPLFAARELFAQFDQVYPADGSPIRGTIKTIGPNEVVIENSRGEQKIQVNEIKRITFRDDPSKLSQARDAALGGRFQSALEDLGDLEAADLKSDATREDAAWLRAYVRSKLALSGNGDLNAAGADLKNFLEKYPDSWRFYEANELFGDLAVAAGKYDRATPFYQALSKAPWPDYKMRAAVLEARALMHQDKHAEALPKFEQVLAEGDTSPQAAEQKLQAQVGKIKCLAATGQHNEGVKLCEELIANNNPTETRLFAGVYNALGACHLKANRPNDAVLAYLHVHLLYSAEAESHAEALYHLGKVWTQKNRSDRAVLARELLKEKYGGSPWASKE